MATSCITCRVIGTRDNEAIKRSLQGRYCKAGSKVCEQYAEMSGCYVPEDRQCFIPLGPLGPRGFTLPRTNPPGPALVCARKSGASKVGDSCSPPPETC